MIDQPKPKGVNLPVPGASRPATQAASTQATPSSNQIATWIKSQPLQKHPASELVEQAESLASNLVAAGLTTTQIRKLLAKVNSLSAQLKAGAFQVEDVPLLKVQLVYAAAREKEKVGPLAEVLLSAIDQIHDEKDFRWFAKFVEATVAFHKFKGGRD